MLLRFNIDAMYTSTRIIHIYRRDRIDQAISFSIANQTNQWTADQENRSEKPPSFLFNDIEDRAAGSLFSTQAVRYISSLFDILMWEVEYEAVSSNPGLAVAAIGAFYGIDLSNWTPAEPRLKNQASAINVEFRDNFTSMARKLILGTGDSR